MSQQRVVPEHVWQAAVRLTQKFFAITPQEKQDRDAVMDENARQSQIGRAITK